MSLVEGEEKRKRLSKDWSEEANREWLQFQTIHLLYEEMPRIIVKAIFAPNYCHFCFTNNFGISQPIPARVISID